VALTAAEELGRAIAGISNTQNSLKEDIVGDEIEQSILLSPIDTTQLETTVTLKKNVYPTDSFIIDHPVYGEIDSSTLEIDGGYLAGSTDIVLDTYTG